MARLLLRLLLVLTLGGLTLGACGDDDGGGDGAAVVADDGGGSGSEADNPGAGQSDDDNRGGGSLPDGERDLCALLTVEEIEAQFGERGVVSDGRPQMNQCEWLIGEDQASMDSGGVYVYLQELIPGAPPAEETFASMRESLSSAEVVDDIGDEAVYVERSGTLHARSGDLIWYVQATFVTEVPGTLDRLITLAESVDSRL